MSSLSDSGSSLVKPSFKEAFLFWLKLGFISFGGPGGQIAIMHAELVDKKKWISEGRFLHALNFCMLLPGPEAQQLATYLGWILHRTWGGLVAGLLFVLPSVFILWALSAVYVYLGEQPAVAGIFYGLKAAVLAIVMAAVWRIGGRSLKKAWMWVLALLAFVGIFFLSVPFPVIVLGAGLLGFLVGVFKPDWIVMTGHGGKEAAAENEAAVIQPSGKRLALVLGIGLTLWWLPILLSGGIFGWESSLFQAGLFFSKAALVTFGGAYAVLPYVAQQAVETYGWLGPRDVMAGVALAETTPGPLIMVLQFYGFLAGWNQPFVGSAFWSATWVGFLATWATFAPCFLFIFAGAPYVERLRGVKLLNAALTAVTAAVVGVILNLGVWLGQHLLWPQNLVLAQTDWVALALALASFLAITRFKIDILWVLPVAGLLGFLWKG
ncbi:MAG: chromate efflux transporter [Blastochloris sp.]|nr:chromate efflux transporter [Blastochloris sp.]